MAAFRSVAAALQATIEIQCALEAHTRAQPEAPLRARVGVHAGEPLPEEGRLFGTCVNTAVRVCAAAGGQRVLVSDLGAPARRRACVPFRAGRPGRAQGPRTTDARASADVASAANAGCCERLSISRRGVAAWSSASAPYRHPPSHEVADISGACSRRVLGTCAAVLCMRPRTVNASRGPEDGSSATKSVVCTGSVRLRRVRFVCDGVRRRACRHRRAFRRRNRAGVDAVRIDGELVRHRAWLRAAPASCASSAPAVWVASTRRTTKRTAARSRSRRCAPRTPRCCSVDSKYRAASRVHAELAAVRRGRWKMNAIRQSFGGMHAGGQGVHPLKRGGEDVPRAQLASGTPFEAVGSLVPLDALNFIAVPSTAMQFPSLQIVTSVR